MASPTKKRRKVRLAGGLTLGPEDLGQFGPEVEAQNSNLGLQELLSRLQAVNRSGAMSAVNARRGLRGAIANTPVASSDRFPTRRNPANAGIAAGMPRRGSMYAGGGLPMSTGGVGEFGLPRYLTPGQQGSMPYSPDIESNQFMLNRNFAGNLPANQPNVLPPPPRSQTPGTVEYGVAQDRAQQELVKRRMAADLMGGDVTDPGGLSGRQWMQNPAGGLMATDRAMLPPQQTLAGLPVQQGPLGAVGAEFNRIDTRSAPGVSPYDVGIPGIADRTSAPRMQERFQARTAARGQQQAEAAAGLLPLAQRQQLVGQHARGERYNLIGAKVAAGLPLSEEEQAWNQNQMLRGLDPQTASAYMEANPSPERVAVARQQALMDAYATIAAAGGPMGERAMRGLEQQTAGGGRSGGGFAASGGKPLDISDPKYATAADPQSFIDAVRQDYPAIAEAELQSYIEELFTPAQIAEWQRQRAQTIQGLARRSSAFRKQQPAWPTLQENTSNFLGGFGLGQISGH